MGALGIALVDVPCRNVLLYLVGALELTQLLLGVKRDLLLIN